MVLCCVEAGNTGYCQPLDIATMRVFTPKLRRFTSRAACAAIAFGRGLDMKKELNKVVLRQSVMSWVGAALDDLARER